MALPDTQVAAQLSDPQRRVAFALVLATTFGSCLIFGLVPPLLPALSEHFGGGPAAQLGAQLGLTMPSLGWLIGGAVSGWVVGALGIRSTIVAAVTVVGLAGAAGGLFSDPAPFVASRFLVGFAGSFMMTGAITLLADIYDDATRPKMFGYQKAMGSFAAVPINLGVGVLAEVFDWRAPFVLYAVFGVLCVVLALCVRALAPALTRTAAGDAGAERGALQQLWPILALIFCLHILPMMSATQLPFLLEGRGLGSAQGISIVLSICAFLMSVASIASGHLQARFGVWRVLYAGALLAGVGYFAMGLATNVFVVAVFNAVALFGCGLYAPHYLILPLASVPPGRRAVTIGLIQSATYLGSFLNPFLLAPVRAQVGYDGVYLLVGGTAALAALIGISIHRVR